MFVVIKEKKTTYIGVSNRTFLCDMSAKDMLLEENISVWKIARRKGWYMVCSRLNPATDILRYAKNLFDKEITYQSLMRYTVPKIKKILEERGLVKDRYWYNEAVIVSKDKAYAIDGYFCVREVTDFDVADAREDIVRGCLEFNRDLPAKARMCEGIRALEEARGKGCFPAIVLDVAMGKREAWYSYEHALTKNLMGKGDKV